MPDGNVLTSRQYRVKATCGCPGRRSILVSTMVTAKIFRNGRSQAVRLPKEFRFKGDEVGIRRSGDKVILEPTKRRPWPRGYWKSWGKVPKDFCAPEPLPSGTPRADFDDV